MGCGSQWGSGMSRDFGGAGYGTGSDYGSGATGGYGGSSMGGYGGSSGGVRRHELGR